MGYEDDPYIDEDGEPLMDPDELSDRERSPKQEPDFGADGYEDEEDWRRERSPTPAMDESKGGKPRKRLVKKTAGKGGSPGSPDRGYADEEEEQQLDDWNEEDRPSSSKKRKAPSGKEGKGISGKDRRKSLPSKMERSVGHASKSGSKGDESEMKEMWDTIASADSEDDQDGVRNADDDNFIDDSGVDPADRYGSDNDAPSPDRYAQAEEGEEDDEIKQIFKSNKKKKKTEKSPAEIALIVEHVMAELEVTAEEDAELNRQSKPAVNKLKKLPLLVDVLSKKTLQLDFLDHGILTILRTWLEPLPDGSLPNMNIRSAILKILTDFPVDLEQNDRREQLKKSGLGRVIMFLSKTDEETTANRKLAKELVDKWSRPIFNKSTRFEDMRSYDDNERLPPRRPPMKKPLPKAAGLEDRDEDIDVGDNPRGRKPGQGASRQHASRPEALPLDFVVRPQSKVDPDEVRARAKQVVQDQRRLKMNKRLQQLKAPKKKQLQASKLSVEGRGMVKYL